MKALWIRLWALPVIVRLIIAGVVLFLLLMLTSFGRDKLFNFRSWLFDRSQAAKTEKELALEKKSDEAIKRAEKAEAIGAEAIKRAEEAEAQRSALQALIDDKGGQIAREAGRLDTELKKIHEQDGTCAALPDEKQRIACLCAKLKAKGFDCE